MPTLFLEDIFVLEEYRRQGVGKTMFGFLIETARCEGCGRIEFTVLKWNKLAQEFYKKKELMLGKLVFYRVAKIDF